MLLPFPSAVSFGLSLAAFATQVVSYRSTIEPECDIDNFHVRRRQKPFFARLPLRGASPCRTSAVVMRGDASSSQRVKPDVGEPENELVPTTSTGRTPLKHDRSTSARYQHASTGAAAPGWTPD